MSIKKKLIVIGAALFGLAASQASAVDFHGYFRSPIGGSFKGGSLQCFGAPGADYKFRLGNECTNYAEWELSQSLYKSKEGIEFVYDGMIGYQTHATQDFETLTKGNDTGDIFLRQNWVGAKGLPFLGGGMAWIGKRYFHRNDVHQIDFFYWDTSGAGGGLDDVPIGPAKFAISVFENKYGDERRAVWRPDFRVYGIPIIPNGTLEAGISLYIDSTNDSRAGLTPNPNKQDFSPWITVQWVQTDFLGGFNKVAFQWAQGSASPMSPYPDQDANSDHKQWRVTEHMVYQLGEAISGALVFVYQNKDQVYGGPSHTTWSAGVRPALTLMENFKIEADAGYTSLKPKAAGANTLGLFKLTVAPTIMPAAGPGGSYFTRPVLRLFLTYANWNDAAQSAGILGQSAGCVSSTTTSPFGCDKNGVTFGAQVEAWY